MEHEERSLQTLVEDIRTLLNFLWMILEFIVATSYYCGKCLTEGAGAGLELSWTGFCGAAEILKALFHALIEFEESSIRGLFVLHYHVEQLYDAFQVTMTDFVDFISKLCDTHVSLLESSLAGGLVLLRTLCFTVPNHICLALAIIGDSVLELVLKSWTMTKDLGLVVVYAPVKLLSKLGTVSIYVVHMPVEAIKTIPASAYLGCFALCCAYMLYKKISIWKVLVATTGALRYLWRGTIKLRILIYEALLIISGKKSSSASKRLSRSPSSSPVKGMCVICQENTVSYIANPCNHVCLCEKCVRMMVRYDNRCPMCRDRVEQYAKVYVS